MRVCHEWVGGGCGSVANCPLLEVCTSEIAQVSALQSSEAFFMPRLLGENMASTGSSGGDPRRVLDTVLQQCSNQPQST